MNILFEELEKMKFRKKMRKNVNNNSYGYSIFHYTDQKFHRPRLSTLNKKYPKVYQILMDIIKEKDKDFNFTSIIINKNNVCKKHKDQGNIGDSYIFAVGNYTGGKLFIENKPYNIKNNLIKFNGSKQEHWSKKFKGSRYSIVYYTMNTIKNYLNNNSTDLLIHKDLKFHFRKFTTDYKVFEEVIIKNIYQKYNVKFNKDQVWLDLGSNIGTFTCLAGKQCKKIYSYEVEQENYELLEENVKLNNLNNVEIFNVGITQKGIENKLYLCNTAYNKYQHSLIHTTQKNSIDIQTKKFKDILTPDINCVKMDIEGCEIEILENNNFDNIDIFIFEYSFKYDKSTKRLVNIIEKLKKNFNICSNLAQIYVKDVWDSYPMGKLVYCLRDQSL